MNKNTVITFLFIIFIGLLACIVFKSKEQTLTSPVIITLKPGEKNISNEQEVKQEEETLTMALLNKIYQKDEKIFIDLDFVSEKECGWDGPGICFDNVSNKIRTYELTKDTKIKVWASMTTGEVQIDGAALYKAIEIQKGEGWWGLDFYGLNGTEPYNRFNTTFYVKTKGSNLIEIQEIYES